MNRILFVDDEPKVLEGLQRMLYALRNEWEMEFVSSGRLALQRLAEAEFDVLVTDIRMPVMSGIELLTEVIERHPQVIRLVLSGTVDQELTLRSAAVAHQYLVKPCDAKTLRAKVERAFSLRTMLEDPGLRRLISSINALPSPPATYIKLLEALRSPETSVREIGAIVEQDVGMTAKVLQLVNSAFMGISRHVSTPSEAIVYLGIETLRALALSASVFSQFHPAGLPGFSAETLQEHSLKVGTLAREIGKNLNLSRTATDDAFVGGLLHDVGKLVLAHYCPESYREALQRAQKESLPIREAEQAVFGTTHAEVGGYLLWLWGLPDTITEVAALHHRLPEGRQHAAGAVLAVHIADALLNPRPDQALDWDHLRDTPWIANLPEWRARTAELPPSS